MYYHNSPIVKTIKQLKASRAADMASATAGMKQISASYSKILNDLSILRDKELQADQLLVRFPEKKTEIKNKMTHNYKLMENKLNKFLSEE